MHLDDFVTPHFLYKEVVFSDWAERHDVPNDPTPAQLAVIKEMLEVCAEPIRLHFGLPVDVNSIFRSERVNEGVRGSKTSSHRALVHPDAPFGEAAIDLEIKHPKGPSNLDLARWAVKNLSYFDQVILENYDASKGKNSGWVHIGYRAGVVYNRKQVWTKLRGIDKLQSGLPPDPP